MIYIFDVEVYPNLFTAVFYTPDGSDKREFVFHETRNDAEELRAFLKEDHWFIGFYNKAYDNHILTAAMYGAGCEELYSLSHEMIVKGKRRWDEPPFKFVDLMLVNNYENAARMTSLKWVSFSMRLKNLADLPVPPDKLVAKGRVKDIIKYNHIDVEHTTDFYNVNAKHLKLRADLVKMYKDGSFMNLSEPKIGKEVFLRALSESTGTPISILEKGRTEYKSIALKDCISDKVKFKTEGFQSALDYFRTKSVRDKDPESGAMILKGSCDYILVHDEVEYKYGVGGLHGANKPGVYESNEDLVIRDVDFTSYYPMLSITQGIFPKHMGEAFLKTYQEIFDKRVSYAKGTTENYVYKIVLNSVFGQMMSIYTPFYDPKAFLRITINGQLFLSMLIEAYSKLGTIIQANTDGVTFILPRKAAHIIDQINERFTAYTGLLLESQDYQKMILKDVNNYIAITPDGKSKRKGLFEIYQDYIDGHNWHKNPSAMVISTALHEYFVNGKNVEEHILAEKNMHEFCFGIKKKSNFEHIIWSVGKNGVIENEKFPFRVLRYFVSENGGSLFKHFNDGRITGVNVGQKIKPLMNMRWTDVDRYDVDKQWYVDEANKIINEIENQKICTE